MRAFSLSEYAVSQHIYDVRATFKTHLTDFFAVQPAARGASGLAVVWKPGRPQGELMKCGWSAFVFVLFLR